MSRLRSTYPDVATIENMPERHTGPRHPNLVTRHRSDLDCEEAGTVWVGPAPAPVR